MSFLNGVSVELYLALYGYAIVSVDTRGQKEPKQNYEVRQYAFRLTLDM